MELMKKSIYTDKIKAKAMLQIPLEEDINVSDSRPDVGRLVFTRGRVKIDEIKTGMNKIWVKGKLLFQVLYEAEGKESGMAGMEGEVPFMEEIYMERVESQDRVICESMLEDMRVNMINSRKLSIQAVISLTPRVEELVETKVCTGIADVRVQTEKNGISSIEGEQLEYRRKQQEYLETIVCKRDLLRIHEESRVGSALPAVGSLLWKSIEVTQVDFKPLEEKLAVSGEMTLFLVYTEEMSGKINWFETAIPFSGNVECQSCRESMIADVSYDVGHEEIIVREDADGEARMIGVELALELEMKLLCKEETQVIADVYGVSCEVETITQKNIMRKLQQDMYVEEKFIHNTRLEEAQPRPLQLCHSDARLEIEDCSLGEDEILWKGTIQVRTLYLSDEDGGGFHVLEDSVPFQLTRQVLGMQRQEKEVMDQRYTLKPQLTKLHASLKDGNQIEWRGVIQIHMPLYDINQEDMLEEIEIGELDSQKLEKLPGFAVYFVKKGDTLWQIGKKYYVSVEKIKEMNQLTSDEIKPGDKLLIVKAGEIE
ncbi:MAG: DUF3794 domain-containing protein [Lachnospiraceae bacterium]|nr:DUF3794 domain-containing protein [Lachnospiraceae bacterium]MBQ6993447.1 DUF3794 domain-containing protein [Lachnospiraceae bacterium]